MLQSQAALTQEDKKVGVGTIVPPHQDMFTPLITRSPCSAPCDRTAHATGFAVFSVIGSNLIWLISFGQSSGLFPAETVDLLRLIEKRGSCDSAKSAGWRRRARLLVPNKPPHSLAPPVVSH